VEEWGRTEGGAGILPTGGGFGGGDGGFVMSLGVVNAGWRAVGWRGGAGLSEAGYNGGGGGLPGSVSPATTEVGRAAGGYRAQ